MATSRKKVSEEFEPDKGDVLKFVEQAELVTEVKDKVADVIGNRAAPQIIQSQDALKYLKKHLDSDLTTIICSLELGSLIKYTRARRPEALTQLQARNVAAAYVILDILLSHLPLEQAKRWLVNYSDYLYGFPAVEISRRPEDVRMAALQFISMGE
jgi:hypothetical protein